MRSACQRQNPCSQRREEGVEAANASDSTRITHS